MRWRSASTPTSPPPPPVGRSPSTRQTAPPDNYSPTTVPRPTSRTPASQPCSPPCTTKPPTPPPEATSTQERDVVRPVQLDIAGFASFRDPAVVDFTGADYFALVGPTGSGKSTVIDAMTFALYGSAPRWGRRNAIANALAPTANRCTVR